jgi:hypothetical protein
MSKVALSTEYPKWLYKGGARDILVRDEDEEAEWRAKGYSHELNQEAPTAANWTQVAPPAKAEPQPGTVPTAVMDSALDAMKVKFDGAWERKCKELDDEKSAHGKTAADRDEFQRVHDKLAADHKALMDEHVKLLAEQNAQLTAAKLAKPAKPEPVIPPVTAKA